ncbi:hypothetical protein WS71_03765 [Burkholderia mayonis]|uniref:Uncharacterized protein n=1 Tax=Burkholderia mayonis TaxID=1385591 RepID=A0A1B4FSC6_9BURK|nr:hypothetical protein WS71_03765 [Burkholderia mayonis]KVE51237.1 hypothetical protein WS71_13075 [Burkholderia mayonis]
MPIVGRRRAAAPGACEGVAACANRDRSCIAPATFAGNRVASLRTATGRDAHVDVQCRHTTHRSNVCEGASSNIRR